jgi:hypothetical protein
MSRHRHPCPLAPGLIALALTLVTGPASVRADAAASQAIAEVLAVHGGRAALARVHAYRAEGTIESRTRGVTVRTVRVFQRPDRLKVLIDYPGHPEARLVDGGRGWRTRDPDRSSRARARCSTR